MLKDSVRNVSQEGRCVDKSSESADESAAGLLVLLGGLCLRHRRLVHRPQGRMGGDIVSVHPAVGAPVASQPPCEGRLVESSRSNLRGFLT